MMIGWTNEEDNKEIQEKGGKDVNVWKLLRKERKKDRERGVKIQGSDFLQEAEQVHILELLCTVSQSIQENSEIG
jgi:hypothetical protein